MFDRPDAPRRQRAARLRSCLALVGGAVLLAAACSTAGQNDDQSADPTASATTGATQSEAGDSATDADGQTAPDEADDNGTANTTATTTEDGIVPEITTRNPSNRTFQVTQIRADGDRPAGEFNSALRGDRDSPVFGQPLVELDEITDVLFPDAIAAILSPSFHEIEHADWLAPQEAVIALEINGDARAYPTQVLTRHEIVNDTVGGVPVTVTYCPLCNSAVVYHRQVGERTLSFGTSGALYNSALVMYDHQTESLWAHFTGQAIVGDLVGTELQLIPAATVSWATFGASHPNGVVLARPIGLSGSDYGTNPYPNYDSPDGRPYFSASGVNDDRLPPLTRVLLVRRGGDAVAVETTSLADAQVAHLAVGGDNVVAFWQSGTASPLQENAVALGRDVGATAVFLPEIEGRQLTFAPADAGDDDRGAFTDTETGTTWTLLGEGIAGPLQGHQLQPVEHLDTFWFAAASYSPDVELFELN